MRKIHEKDAGRESDVQNYWQPVNKSSLAPNTQQWTQAWCMRSGIDQWTLDSTRKSRANCARYCDNFTTIFVTHDESEAHELADRVVTMNEGVIEQVTRAAA